jgi:XRE family transcriptional regulator, regulator of sulfur utilization
MLISLTDKLSKMTRFGEKIRLLRLENGFSQENMADMLGISTTAYGDLERNKSELTVSRLEKIALILKVEIGQLMGFSSEIQSLEILKLKAEKERFEIESLYWREKYEAKILADSQKIQQIERQPIGFMKAS